MSHYFINDPNLKDDYRYYDIHLKGISFRFYTQSGVFSQKGLDFGTKTLLENIIIPDSAQTIIDVGCGYGPLGIIFAKANPKIKVIMVDVNKRALELAKLNAKENNVDNIDIIESDLLKQVHTNADVIMTNPPIRTGKQNIFRLYEESYSKLNSGGFFYCVIQKKQGAPSTLKKLQSLFVEAEVIRREKGYWVILARK
ncbi:MAG: methyltransferase [Acholeplasmataceae bacterium]